MKKGYFQIRVNGTDHNVATYKNALGLTNDRYGIHGSRHVLYTVTQLKSGLAIHKFEKMKDARKFVNALGKDELTVDEMREIRDKILEEIKGVKL